MFPVFAHLYKNREYAGGGDHCQVGGVGFPIPERLFVQRPMTSKFAANRPYLLVGASAHLYLDGVRMVTLVVLRCRSPTQQHPRGFYDVPYPGDDSGGSRISHNEHNQGSRFGRSIVLGMDKCLAGESRNVLRETGGDLDESPEPPHHGPSGNPQRQNRVQRYAPGYGRTKPHYTASMAKALVGGVSLMMAMDDRRITPDNLASKFVPQWINDPKKNRITVRRLATHTSGIEDAETDNLPHGRLTGWKGDFWKGLPPPTDPFTIARDLAPVLDVPGTKERYSNPGMAMLGYCITASLRGAKDTDLRSLLKHRIMEPIGVPDSEWSMGYGTTFKVTVCRWWPHGAAVPTARTPWQGSVGSCCTRATGKANS